MLFEFLAPHEGKFPLLQMTSFPAFTASNLRSIRRLQSNASMVMNYTSEDSRSHIASNCGARPRYGLKTRLVSGREPRQLLLCLDFSSMGMSYAYYYLYHIRSFVQEVTYAPTRYYVVQLTMSILCIGNSLSKTVPKLNLQR